MISTPRPVSPAGRKPSRRMRELAQGPEEWVVIVDLDEFVEFSEPVNDLARKVEVEGGNIARGIMYDRFAIDGQLKAFTTIRTGPALFPVRARFRRVVMGGNEIKGVLVKGALGACPLTTSFTTRSRIPRCSRFHTTSGTTGPSTELGWRATCVPRRTAHGILTASSRGSSTTMNGTVGSPGKRLAAKSSAGRPDFQCRLPTAGEMDETGHARP